MKKRRRRRKQDRSRYKTFWRRFWAGTADGVVLLPFTYVSRVVWAHSESLPNAVLVFFHVIHSFAGMAYTILLHGFFGQTLGKMLFKVKVIDASEDAAITMMQALRRDAVPLALRLVGLSSQIPTIFRLGGLYDPDTPGLHPLAWVLMSSGLLWFFAEIVTMMTNRRRRAVHDFIAGSVVIRIPKQGGRRVR